MCLDEFRRNAGNDGDFKVSRDISHESQLGDAATGQGPGIEARQAMIVPGAFPLSSRYVI